MNDLDWTAPIIPGHSVFNLNLGLSYAEVVDILKLYETSEGFIQLKNAPLMALRKNKNSIQFRKLESQNYDWQYEVILLYFVNDHLESIVVDDDIFYIYKGSIFGAVFLGDEIRELQKYVELMYDDYDEVMRAFENGKVIGLELYGSCCDLSVDPDQKIGGLRVYLPKSMQSST
jgi:hypothetical protein